MTKIRIFRRGKNYRGFEASDHAGYAEEGEDIVCAAVSVLTINAVNSIEYLAGDKVEEREDDGYLSCSFPEGLSKEGNLLMDSLILGLQSVERGYGKSFVNVEFEEV